MRQTKSLRRRLAGTALSLLSARTSAVVLAFLAVPQLAVAATEEFSDPTLFEARLQSILSGSGASSLTFTGDGTLVGPRLFAPELRIEQNRSLPGSNSSLLIDLGQGALLIDQGKTTINAGTTIQLGLQGSEAYVKMGSADGAGELHINGGTLNMGNTGSSNQLQVGYDSPGAGTLRITNGGVVNLGLEPGANYHSGVFVGYVGAGSLLMDDGSMTIGSQGASMRFGIGTEAHVELKNGSIIDSSAAASHFRVGERSTGHATMLIEDSTLIIQGQGTRSGIDDRYFLIGMTGSTGTMTQRGNSVVAISGLALTGIGQGVGSTGTYNLEGGSFTIGREGILDNFVVGEGFEAQVNTSTANFNISGGEALIWGDLRIAQNGGYGEISTGNFVTSYATGTVTMTGGAMEVRGKVRFGQGVGTLNLNGGVLTVHGTDAILGNGTLNYNGGTLKAGSAATITRAATVGDNGIILDGSVASLTYSGVLSGTGGIHIADNSTVVLSGENTLTGDSSVGAGAVVTMKSASSFGSTDTTISLNDASELIMSGFSLMEHDLIVVNGEVFLSSDLTNVPLVVAGNVSGAGTLRVSGDEILLQAAVTTGTLSVDAGSHLEFADSDLLSEDTTLDVLGSALIASGQTQTASGLAGSGEMTIDGLLNIGGSDGSSEFSGSLSGSGIISKSGEGTFSITKSESSDSAGDFDGNLDILAGGFVLNGTLSSAQIGLGGDARFGGNNTILSLSTLGGEEGGVIAPGNSIGTITVLSDTDLTGLVSEIEVDGNGDSDLIIVLGDVVLGGELRILHLDGPSASLGHIYRIFAADSFSGEFDDINSGSIFFDATVEELETVDGFDLLLTLTRNELTFGALARTPNQRAVAGAIDALGADSPVGTALLGMTEEEIPGAYDMLSGEIFAAANMALIEDSRQLREIFNARLRGSLNGTRSQGVWATAYGTKSSADSDGNGADFSRNSGGMLAGFDTDLGGWQVGTSLGMGNSSFDLKDRGSKGSADTLQFGLYAGQNWDRMSLRTGLSFAHAEIETTRRITLGERVDTAKADYAASTVQVFGELGYQFETSAGSFEPFVNVAHVRVSTAGYTERGTDLALRSSQESLSANFATIGFHAGTAFELSGLAAQARGTLALQHASGDLTGLARHSFASGDNFAVKGSGLAETSALIEAGVDVQLSPGARLNVSYGGGFAEGSSAHRGQIGLNISF